MYGKLSIMLMFAGGIRPSRRRNNHNTTSNTMKTTMTMALCAAAAVILTSCGAPRVGAIYTDVKAPVAASSGGGSRVGTATSTTYLGLVATGDASIAAAKRNGGITSVNSVDEHVKSILGIVTTYTTTVRGN